MSFKMATFPIIVTIIKSYYEKSYYKKVQMAKIKGTKKNGHKYRKRKIAQINMINAK